MVDVKEFYVHMDKVIRTIKSCETHDHLDGAKRFAEAMIRFHIYKMLDTKGSEKKQYQLMIEDSNSVIEKQLSLQKCLVKYGK